MILKKRRMASRGGHTGLRSKAKQMVSSTPDLVKLSDTV